MLLKKGGFHYISEKKIGSHYLAEKSEHVTYKRDGITFQKKYLALTTLQKNLCSDS